MAVNFIKDGQTERQKIERKTDRQNRKAEKRKREQCLYSYVEITIIMIIIIVIIMLIIIIITTTIIIITIIIMMMILFLWRFSMLNMLNCAEQYK